MIQENKDLARLFFTALGNGDAELMQQILHPQLSAVATGTGMMSGTRNCAEVIGTLVLLKQLLPQGIEFKVVSTTAEDDRVSAEVEGYATTKNGKPYNNQYHFLMTIRDHKIFSVKEYFCTKLADEILGPLIANMGEL